MLKKNLVYVATVTLLFSILSCNNNSSDLKAGITINDKIFSQITEKPSSSQLEKTVTTSPKIDGAESAKFTNLAMFLAGMKVDESSPLASGQKNQAWKTHAAFFNNVWGGLEKQQLLKLKQWADKELKPINQSSKVVFYPFSGPDFLYSYSFFPKKNTYILAGLEPLGSLPNLEKSSATEVNRNLQGIDQSLKALLQWSFFRTNDMRVDLSQQGVLPILFVFLARTNNKIIDVQYVGIKKDSTIQNLEKGNKEKLIPGVKIDFIPKGESELRSLYYFSIDLSNSALKKTPEFNKFVQNLGSLITYLKSASYLLHYGEFSNIRNLILSRSINVLQDDSGIPVKYLDKSKWNLNFYGSYTQPISLFNEEYQSNLKSIYQSKTNVKPLTFGIGYRYKINDSNLMLAARKE